jgi:UDP-N-acetylmuramoyl-tripeptide--D-alanyl-D-alanine ligase
MRAGLRLLGELGQGKRTVAVLGEMRELGHYTEAEHRAIEVNASLLITCGGAADFISGNAIRARDAAEAAKIALREVKPGDVVLVKGSRGVRTEQVVEALKGRG